MAEYLLGIDVGTGSLKGLAVDRTGSVISSQQVSYPLIQETEFRCEQDPEVIWNALLTCVQKLAQELGNPAGVVLSSAMHSLILIGDNDAPITNMITWADNRAGEIAERLHRSAAGEMLYEQTGTPIHAMSPLCKIIWFKEQSPEIFGQATKFISIKEFLWYKLFKVFEADYSIASATGLMDIEGLKWNDNALSLAGLTPENLSFLVDTNHTRTDLQARVAKEMGIASSTPFVIGASDGCMANLGSFATEKGIAALTIGTSGAVRVASTGPVHNFKAMTFNYRLDKDTYICGGPTNNGGVVMKWYAEKFLGKELGSATDYQELIRKIAKVDPGSEGLIFLPYILGERAPIWNSDATGVFFGIRNNHTQAHFTRAVIEGISMALYNIMENMERCGLEIKQINVSGGFVHSTEWLQIIANVFGKKICLTNSSDASALGAAFLGLKTTGLISSYTELSAKPMKEILPEENHRDIYIRQYRLFEKLYVSLQPLMA